jgi:hypothetical protein
MGRSNVVGTSGGVDVVILLALAKFAIQFATAGGYGIFCDELYYLACAQHLQAGYVDLPPLIAVLAWISVHLFGASLFGLRFLPAVAGGLLVWVTGRIAKELGGGKFAQGLAAFAVIPVPIYLMLDHWLTMNAFEPLLWMTVAWLAVRMARTRDLRLWAPIGLICGIGMENKYTMILPIAGLVVSLLLTPQRKLFKSGWLIAGLMLGALAVLPNLIWLIDHHFPFLEFEKNARGDRAQLMRAPLAFVADQMTIMNPLLAPLWLGGLAWLFFAKLAHPVRFLGWFFLSIFLVLMIVRAKNYYVAPVYPVLFAAGAVGFEAWSASRRWARGVYAGAVLAAGLFLAPFVLPILPINSFIAYQQAFGGFRPVIIERTAPGPLPLQFAAEIGWEEMAAQTAKVFHSLRADEQKTTAIFANDYSEAGAIDFFGPKYGLPPAIGKDVSYWLWGPRNYTGQTVIVLGSDGKGDRQHFREVIAAGRAQTPFSRTDEQFDIFLCRDLNTDLRRLWPSMKHWGQPG